MNESKRNNNCVLKLEFLFNLICKNYRIQHIILNIVMERMRYKTLNQKLKI